MNVRGATENAATIPVMASSDAMGEPSTLALGTPRAVSRVWYDPPEVTWMKRRLLTIFSALSLLLARRYVVLARRKGPGLCPTCGYDLRATPERCPECGRVEVVG